MDYLTQASALYRSQRQINEEAYQWWLKNPTTSQGLAMKGTTPLRLSISLLLTTMVKSSSVMGASKH